MSANVPATLEVFFDFVSPSSSLAATQVEAPAQRNGAGLAWRPFLLGADFEATGNPPPLGVLARGTSMPKDLMDRLRCGGLPPLAMPSTIPMATVRANRLAVAALAEGRGQAPIHATNRATVVGESDTLGALAAGAGLDPAAALARIEAQDVKDERRRHIDDAVACRAFDAPTSFVGEDMDWGNERLPLVDMALTRRPGVSQKGT